MIFFFLILIIYCLTIILANTNNQYTNDKLNMSLYNAAGNGDTNLVKTLIVDYGADPNYHDYVTILGITAQNSLYNRISDVFGFNNPWVDTMEVLVSHGADPCKLDTNNNTAYQQYMQYVKFYPHPDIKKMLDIC
jgi:hypothetical protein